jgi:hypothetical protein
VASAPGVTQPAWVYKRDGRLVPFEPDKISRALFAASETLGRPDAFLARELTDGILHFLPGEIEESIPTTAQLADVVLKIVRELGQPLLAQTFADFSRQRTRMGPQTGGAGREKKQPELVCQFSPQDSLTTVVHTCLRTYGLHAVYSRDLIAAQQDGLLILTGVGEPLQLNATILDPTGLLGETVVEALEKAGQVAGSVVAIDGPEYGLAAQAEGDAGCVVRFVRELYIGLRIAGLEGVVNLNSATPPSWADPLAEGPLFAGHHRAVQPDKRAELASALREALLGHKGAGQRARVDWHLGEMDFAPGSEGQLFRLARLAQETPALAFVFDRPKKNVSLAEGLERRHPAVLLTVGLRLPRLVQMPGLSTDPTLFLQKLGSLVRLALSAASQKRDFLRRRHGEESALSRGFLLARARLVVVPVGLDSVARTFTGKGLCDGHSAGELARKIIQRLREILRQDGPAYQLETVLDGAYGFSLEEDPCPNDEGRRRQAVKEDAGASLLPFTQWPAEQDQVAGLTAWDKTATPKSQLRAAGVLHAATAGSAAVLVPGERPLPLEEIAELLRYAATQTEIVRLRFVRAGEQQRQLTAPWATRD